MRAYTRRLGLIQFRTIQLRGQASFRKLDTHCLNSALRRLPNSFDRRWPAAAACRLLGEPVGDAD